MMARIRTIKPEFWDSPSVAQVSPWSRLLFIAMWNWADDHGRGTANLKELEGFAFPNDTKFTDRSGNTVHFRDLVAEVAEAFGVLFYTVRGRPYYEIPSWDDHQRNERRSKGSKHPSPQVDGAVAEIPSVDAETPRTSGPVTGEQGNRGTGEKRPRSSNAAENIEQSVTTSAYEELGKAFNFIAVRQIVKWAIHDRGADPQAVRAAVVDIHRAGKPITKQTVDQRLARQPQRDPKSGLLVER
jgi:hypothetical protein